MSSLGSFSYQAQETGKDLGSVLEMAKECAFCYICVTMIRAKALCLVVGEGRNGL